MLQKDFLLIQFLNEEHHLHIRSSNKEKKKKNNFSIIIKKTRISIKFMTSNRKGKRIWLQQLLLPSDTPWE